MATYPVVSSSDSINPRESTYTPLVGQVIFVYYGFGLAFHMQYIHTRIFILVYAKHV